MAHIELSVDVEVPVCEVYRQWTDYGRMPRIMHSVNAVEEIDEDHLRFVTNVLGQRHAFEAEVTEDRPVCRISWQATSGTEHSGDVSFEPLEGGRSRVSLRMDVEPQTILGKIGTAIGILELEIKNDLQNFKEYTEWRRSEERLAS